MPKHESSRWKFSYGWLRGEDFWGDPVSDNFVRSDMLLHPSVKTMTSPVPPAVLAIGDMFIVGPSALGPWLGKENNLAIFTEYGWIFCEPMTKHIRVGSDSPAGWFWWTGTEWLREDVNQPNPPPLQGTRYDFNLSVGFEAEPLETLAVTPIVEDMTLPDGATDSLGRAMEAPTGICNIAIMRNTEQVGTIRFIPGSVQAEIIVVGNKLFPSGSVLSFKMPSTVPAYFRNYGVTLRMILSN